MCDCGYQIWNLADFGSVLAGKKVLPSGPVSCVFRILCSQKNSNCGAFHAKKCGFSVDLWFCFVG